MRTSFYRPTEKETRATTRGRQPLYIAEDIIDDGARSFRRADVAQSTLTARINDWTRLLFFLSVIGEQIFIAMNSILHCINCLLSFLCGF